MIYIFGFVGFVLGFSVGLGTINVLLRHYSTREIQNNDKFKWTYGPIVWIFALVGCWLGIWIFNHHFL